MSHDTYQLYGELCAGGYKKPVNRILNGPGLADVEASCLHCGDYDKLAQIIPVGRVVVDLGCAYGFQGWFFRHHRGYVAVDASLRGCIRFPFGKYFKMTIAEFCDKHGAEFGGHKSFAICNFVPPWHGEHDRAFVMRSFPELFVFYPQRGDDPELAEAERFLFKGAPEEVKTDGVSVLCGWCKQGVSFRDASSKRWREKRNRSGRVFCCRFCAGKYLEWERERQRLAATELGRAPQGVPVAPNEVTP